MNEHDSWTSFDYNKGPTGLSPETSCKYGVPYSWGALHVTTDADKAYGFVPLTADTVQGDSMNTSEETGFDMRTDVYLMSPQEFLKQTGDGTLPSNTDTGVQGFAATKLHKKGIELWLALSTDTQDFKETMLGNIALFAERFGAEIDDMRSEDDIPIVEKIEQDASQVLIHGLCSLSAETAKKSIAELLIANVGKKTIKHVTRLGASGLTGAGVVLGIDGLVLRAIDPVTISLAMTYVGMYSYLVRRFINNHLQHANELNSTVDVAASRYAGMVANDIHKTFCTADFDRHAEAAHGND